MEVNISDLTWESSIYPRGGKNEKTIEAYMEALNIGAQFPPIKIQKVLNYPDGNEKTEATLILDGLHRWFAFKECGFKEIPVIEWKKDPLDYEKNHITLLLEAANANISHGDRLSSNDKKRIARDIASSDVECKWTEAALAEKLGSAQHRWKNLAHHKEIIMKACPLPSIRRSRSISMDAHYQYFNYLSLPR